MANLVKLENGKSYISKENAIKAVEKTAYNGNDNLRYFIHTLDNGRFIPVFIGAEAIHAGVHFHFNVIA